MTSIAEEFGASAGAKLSFSQKELDGMVHEAVVKESEQLLRLALAVGGSPLGLSNSKHRLSPLGDTILNNKPALARILLAAGASVDDAVYPNSATPLMLTVIHQAHEIMDDLIARKALLNKTDNKDRTALIIAAQLVDDVAVEKLLAAGADAGLVARDGRTALAIVQDMLKAEGALTDQGVVSAKRIVALFEKYAPSNKPALRGRTPGMQ